MSCQWMWSLLGLLLAVGVLTWLLWDRIPTRVRAILGAVGFALLGVLTLVARLADRRSRPGPPASTATEDALRDRADDLRVEAAGLEGQAQAIEERATEDRVEARVEVEEAHATGDVASLWDQRRGRGRR